MSHGTYYGPKIVPCECGSREPYWHGENGLRVYCCDKCWAKSPENPDRAVGGLRRALDFLDACRRDPEIAKATGAMRDAREGLEEAARAVVAENAGDRGSK